MTSRRLAEPWNIQCLPSSLAITRSIVLLTPNGLPQRMQQNGSSSLSTRAGAVAARKSSCGSQRDDLLRAGRLAQPALHAGILGEAQHRPLGIVRQRAGRTGRHAGEAERAAVDVDLDGAERRALRQRDHIDRRGRGAMQFAQGEPQHVALGADGREARRLRRGRSRRDARAARRRSASGSSVSMVATLPAAEAERRSGSVRRARWCGDSPAMSWRGLRAQQEAHRRGAIGERRRDRLEADLRHLVDGERQHIGRQAVAEARQRVDQSASPCAPSCNSTTASLPPASR